jgi:hypothetical protein
MPVHDQGDTTGPVKSRLGAGAAGGWRSSSRAAKPSIAPMCCRCVMLSSASRPPRPVEASGSKVGQDQVSGVLDRAGLPGGMDAATNPVGLGQPSRY